MRQRWTGWCAATTRTTWPTLTTRPAGGSAGRPTRVSNAAAWSASTAWRRRRNRRHRGDAARRFDPETLRRQRDGRCNAFAASHRLARHRRGTGRRRCADHRRRKNQRRSDRQRQTGFPHWVKRTASASCSDHLCVLHLGARRCTRHARPNDTFLRGLRWRNVLRTRASAKSASRPTSGSSRLSYSSSSPHRLR